MNGNTNRSFQPRNWCFTYNNYPSEFRAFEQELRAQSSRYVFQQEVGENGTPHLQGFVVFKSRRRLSTLKRSFFDGIHWEPTRDCDRSAAYCSDPDKRAEGGDCFKFGFPEPLSLISELRPWQRSLCDRLDERANDRTIYWRFERSGGSGKTAFCRWLVGNQLHNAIYVAGKSADVKFAICKHFEADPCHRDGLIVLWDIPRSCESYISYSGIEEVKNGIFFSGKYESGQVIFNHPHVVCFANFEPDRAKLSDDRWNIKEILFVQDQWIAH